VFKTLDGRCVATAQTLDPLQLADGMKDHEQSHDRWFWKRLHSVDLEEVRVSLDILLLLNFDMPMTAKSVVIIALATVDGTPIIQTFDDDEIQERMRLAVFEVSRNGVDELKIEKAGESYLDARHEAVELIRTSDSQHGRSFAFVAQLSDILETIMLFHVSNEGHLIRQQFTLGPRVTLPQAPQAGIHLPGIHLHNLQNLQNPFKPSKPQPTVLSPQRHDAGRVILSAETDIGEMLGGQRVMGLRMHGVRGSVFGIAWSEHEFAVFFPLYSYCLCYHA
jgi:hypothetical protein